MTALLRSRLFRIAMLSFAVLFSQTANAAKSAQLPSPRTPPSSVKLCAAWPESKNDFKGTIKKSLRPNPGPAVRFVFSAAGFLPAGAAGIQASRHTAVDFHLQRLIYVAPQFRPFALRI
jgi:hypothetical protein